MDSALAQLKLEALLAEIRVDYGDLEPAVDAAIGAVKDALMKIPEEKVPRSLASGFLDDLGVPEDKSLLEFKRPESFTLVGSYSTRTMARPATVVDLAMRIPKACFYEKDYLNHRYHAKRALYLAYVFKILSKCGLFKSIEWAFLHHDARKPVLVLHTASGMFDLRVIPTISSNVFDISKLDDGRSNVHNEGTGEPLQATPSYNGSILEDMFVEELSTVEKNLLCHSGRLQEAVMLLKVWLRQRSSYAQPDTMNGFLLSIMILHLSSVAGGQRLSNHMTALQNFRVSLEMIAKYDVLGKGFRLELQGTERRPALMVDESRVLFPDTYGTNLLFRMTKNSLKELKLFAERTLEAMTADSGFQESFLAAVEFASYFDCQIRLEIDDTSKCDFSNDGAWRGSEGKAENVLSKALKDRTKLVRVLRRTIASGWNPKKGLSKFLPSKIQIGAILNDIENAYRMVDVGPSADKKEESAKFRSFWGKKAELRRFKDGTIAEAVGWECEPWKRHLIIARVSEYILIRHFAGAGPVETVSDQLDFSLLDKNQDSIGSTPKILQALEEFTKRLKALALPLKISSVQPISAAFRHAAVYTPRPRHSTKGGVVGVFLEPLEVMIQLEGSGRWPNDVIAIKKTKAAFCLKIADSMHKQWHLDSVVSEDAVDILMNGFAFRISIAYEKDPTLIKHKDMAAISNISIKDDLIFHSVHSSTLNGLQGRCPAYGPTVRLAKRWIGAHLFSDVITEEAIELLVAYIFTRPQPMFPPSTRITGFLRFLRLLANYDWHLSPLIVDINGDMSSKDRETVVAFFEATRRGEHADFYEGSKEGPAMFIATSYDMQSVTSTRCSPLKPALKRLVAYAKSSAALLTSNITGMDNRWQSLFRTPLNCYDTVLVLQRKSLPHPGRVLFSPELGKLQAAFVCPDVRSHLAFRTNQLFVGFNPVVEFVQDIKAKFGDYYDVWYDVLGSDVIGLTLQKQEVFVGTKRKRNDENSIAENLVSLGKGLVASIYLKVKEK
ncbi:nucleolar protein 6 isoform X1 [Selaginella moellendorffii]|uniref:nucleolar protein 6 isoform X1 n=1 Tax=Selaginella moellendorffii TaxID=88036 RepID=UPI000D1C6B94|nr:nucleolar protein 6 isoform X1 [Selaginella moellendorffii]|eukprot:XP_024527195.1 nucleolar protein 6 isoform X1 [Selaginella moellendorffii]